MSRSSPSLPTNAPTPPSTAPFQADSYFHSSEPHVWNLLDFLDKFASDRNLDHARLSHSWVRALNAIATNPDSTPEEKQRALHLANTYQTTDKIVFQQWRDNLVRQASVPAGVSVNNSQQVSINIETDSQPRGKKRTRARKQSGPSRPSAPRKRAKPTSSVDLKRLDQFEKNLADVPVKWFLHADPVSVEDKLAGYVRLHNDRETPAHSFVLDIQDREIVKLFSNEQLEEIEKLLPKLPPHDYVLEDYFKLFKNKSVEEFKDILEEGAYTTVTKALIKSARREKYPNLRWAHQSIDWVIDHYATNSFSRSDHKEKFFQLHVWAGLLDKLMFTIPGVDVISGETPTLASTFRKNQSTLTPSSRKKVGPFHDSVFVYHGTEIGGVENGCEFSIPTARKWTGDTLKLVKVCRDMIVRLHAEHGPERLEKLPMLAVITAGLTAQTSTVSYAAGAVCLYNPHRRVEVPTTMRHSNALFRMMHHLWSVRTLMAQCTRDISDLIQHSTSNPPAHELPYAIDTDPETGFAGPAAGTDGEESNWE